MAKIKILLAEDHVVVREGMRTLIMQQPDMEVVGEAGDGAEAVKLAEKLRPDIVVMDIIMPHVNGIEATKKIKQRLPQTAVIILTAYDDDEFIFILLDSGAAGYLLKSVCSQELTTSIRTIHSGESVLSTAITRKIMKRYDNAMGPGAGDLQPLTRKEMDVLKLAAKGITNQEIADELNLKVQTVRSRLKKAFRKMDVSSRTEAVIYALQKGWISLHDAK